jgi:hypothetical protein
MESVHRELEAELAELRQLRSDANSSAAKLSFRRRSLQKKRLIRENRYYLVDQESRTIERHFRKLIERRQKGYLITHEVDSGAIQAALADIAAIVGKEKEEGRPDDLRLRRRKFAQARNEVREARAAFDREWQLYIGNATLERKARATPASAVASPGADKAKARLRTLRERERADVDELSEFLARLHSNDTDLLQNPGTLVTV